MMNELQQIQKSDLDFCLVTKKLGKIEAVRSSNNNLISIPTIDPEVKAALKTTSTSRAEFATALETKPRTGAEFATALKAKFNGTRPIAEDIIFATLNWRDLKLGRNCLKIQHLRNFKDRRKPYYSTSIVNRSAEPIRIDRFGTYIKIGQTLVLHTITGGFFSHQQFQEWYGLEQSEWIEPGQTVIDPNSHSHLGTHWAYFGTTASGHKFVASSAWNGKAWWQLW
jgi:hypothetical protein